MSMYSKVEFSAEFPEDEILKVSEKISKLPNCGHDDFSVINGNTINAKVALNYGLMTLTKFLCDIEQKIIGDHFKFIGYFSSEELSVDKTNIYFYKSRLYLVDREIFNGYGYSDTHYKVMDFHNQSKYYSQSDYEDEKEILFFIEEYLKENQ